jgi:hypothetical protein
MINLYKWYARLKPSNPESLRALRNKLIIRRKRWPAFDIEFSSNNIRVWDLVRTVYDNNLCCGPFGWQGDNVMVTVGSSPKAIKKHEEDR